MVLDALIWEDYLDNLELAGPERLPYPVRSYFYRIGNLLIFDLKNELDPEIKEMLTIVFDAIFD